MHRRLAPLVRRSGHAQPLLTAIHARSFTETKSSAVAVDAWVVAVSSNHKNDLSDSTFDAFTMDSKGKAERVSHDTSTAPLIVLSALPEEARKRIADALKDADMTKGGRATLLLGLGQGCPGKVVAVDVSQGSDALEKTRRSVSHLYTH